MANTNPIYIFAEPPVRRATAVRHRRSITGWQLERAVRYAKAWLAQPVRATRAQHAKVAGIYAAVSVIAGVAVAALIH